MTRVAALFAVFKKIIILGLITFPLPSFAESLICMSTDQNTRIEVYFAGEGTADEPFAHVQMMVLKDPTVKPARQLIAEFRAQEGLLFADRKKIIGVVDLNHPDTSRGGEKVGGTVLRSISSVVLDVDLSYEEPLGIGLGTRVSVLVIYRKRNGENLTQDFDCLHL